MKQEFIKLLAIYADALETNDVTAHNNYIDLNVAEVTNEPGHPDSNYYTGTATPKAAFKSLVGGTIGANEPDNLKLYIAAIRKVTLADIETSSEPYSSIYSVYFSLRVRPEGFNAFSTIYLDTTYSKPDDGKGNLVLTSIRID